MPSHSALTYNHIHMWFGGRHGPWRWAESLLVTSLSLVHDKPLGSETEFPCVAVNWSDSDEVMGIPSWNPGGLALTLVWSMVGILPGKIMRVHNSPLLGRAPSDWLKESKPVQTCQIHHRDIRAHKASALGIMEVFDHRCPDSVTWSPRLRPDHSPRGRSWSVQELGLLLLLPTFPGNGARMGRDTVWVLALARWP